MGKNNHFSGVTVDVVFVALSVCCLVLLSSFFVYCTIPESMEACFLVVLGGGGGGVLLGRGGGNCCKQTKQERETSFLQNSWDLKRKISMFYFFLILNNIY